MDTKGAIDMTAVEVEKEIVNSKPKMQLNKLRQSKIALNRYVRTVSGAAVAVAGTIAIVVAVKYARDNNDNTTIEEI